ncbi:similar to Saccharomyces cerevisiae YOL026C MIM1 Mitochondrial outer membrane protein [Maudiozyma barnettii]|nr:similar to Saccharomyces cerevisiae YOL026C MIM1 Mitochondrial outer membrane protein [Kazachstania barnettii]
MAGIQEQMGLEGLMNQDMDKLNETQWKSLKRAMNNNSFVEEEENGDSDNQIVEQEKDSQVSLTDSTMSDLTRITRILVSSSVNLLLPFINGMMLGFGELVAHELCWRYNWFDRRNVVAFKIFPESRKYTGLTNNQNQSQSQLSNVL